MPVIKAQAQPRSASVLTKACLRAAELLDVPRTVLARVLGVSAASLSRLHAGRLIDPQSKEGELALLFLRVFRSLDALFGGSVDQARSWFHADNQHLNGKPIDLVILARGLVNVADYLDAMRGKI